MNAVIAYVGDDPDFIKEIERVVHERSCSNEKWSLLVVNEGEGVLSRLIGQKDIAAIIYDFTHHASMISENLCHEFVMFKRLSVGRVKPIVGVFADKEQLVFMRQLFTLGVSFSHVKGADLSLFGKDVAWLASGVQDHLGSFATAKRLDLPFTVQTLAGVVELSPETMWIDCDLVPSQLEMKDFLPFGEFKPRAYAVEASCAHSCWHDAFYFNRLDIIYPGPWDTVVEGDLARDTIETWLANSAEQNIEVRALVITQNWEILRPILGNSRAGKIRISCSDNLNDLKPRLQALKPQILCFDLALDSSLNDYGEVIKSVMEEDSDWRPYVMIYQCPHETLTWRELLKSDRVLTYKGKLDLELLRKLLEVSEKKMPVEAPPSTHRFRLNDPQRIVDFSLPIHVTSFSEHEITFFCNEELPMFTVLSLQAPVPIYLLVIPPFRQLSRNPRGTHYTALLHGMSNEEEELLRQYVNAAIFEPPSEFGRRPTVVVPEQSIPAPKPEVAVETVAPAVPEEPRLIRRVIGKSKL